jgi:FtsH-binding integral membrane protein
MLSFIFEGEVFYSLIGIFDFDPHVMVFGGIAALFLGLLLSGFFIKTKRGARRTFLYSYLFCIVMSVPFFFPPSVLWNVGIIAGSFMSGSCVAAWGYY